MGRGRFTASWVAPLIVGLLAVAIGGSGNAHARTPEPTCPGGSVFAQPPNLGTTGWEAYVSDLTPGFTRYERFLGISSPVCGVRWWGFHLTNPGTGFVECDDGPTSFLITFYADQQGQPGAETGSHAVAATGTAVAEVNGWTLSEYQVVLDSCRTVTDGWVSIRGSGGSPSCWFLWNSSSVGDGAACQRNPQNGLVCGTGQHYRDLSVCLVDSSVPAKALTWGTLKLLYRSM